MKIHVSLDCCFVAHPAIKPEMSILRDPRIGHRNQFRNRDLQPHHAAVLFLQGRETALEEPEQFGGRVQFHVLVDQYRHVGVVFFLAVRVHVVMSCQAADVAVEGRADVIQLVQHRDHLLFERMVQEPRQIERQNIEHLLLILVHPLHRPLAAVTRRLQSPVLKPQGRQLGLHTVRYIAAGLGKGDRDPVHIDMMKFRQPTRDVAAQAVHRVTEIKRLLR